MKVLFLLSSGFNKHTTSEHLLTAVIRSLCEQGCKIHIIQKDLGGELNAIPEKLEKYMVTTTVIPFSAQKKSDFAARYISDLQYLKRCKPFMKGEYDAVFIQSNNIAGFLVHAIRKRLGNVPITYNVQDIFPYNAAYSGMIKKGKILFCMLAAVQRYGYMHCDHIITISEDMRDLLIEDGVPKDKINLVYNWSYQDDPYNKAHLDMTIPNTLFNKKYVNVVYAGNIGVMQNVDVIIEAAALMGAQSDIWFHIIGDGSYKKDLQDKADNLGISNISFWPMQPFQDAPSIYSAADVNVIPLVKDIYRTALPSKTATCLACGKPVIFLIGKNSKFGQKIEKEAGCTVLECDDAKGLRDAILNMKNCALKLSAISFFEKNMKMSDNSAAYADIIIGRK